MKINLKIPDLWQQKAIRHLQAGRDVVVDAPTGAGKTFIFEMFLEAGFRERAIYTVPTRALANDKHLEWRRRGWKVGIATGDLSENLDAPIIVATLETQKQGFLEGRGPGLLVIDEYQMLGDPDRGVNYELVIAMAPPRTQLLLLSGSVANPREVLQWLKRLGRDAALVQTRDRPVPLEEVFLEALPGRVPEKVTGYWPRLVAKALLAGLGPILVFAPKRKASEELARKLSSALPANRPLLLTPEQRRLAGKDLAGLLKNRIAYHHSGLSYRRRAGLVEPLAKAGQLRIVTATTGLAAGINFSLRSVLVTDREYRAGDYYDEVRPDELLQMFGRSGRRGLDKKGYLLVAPGKPRFSEARPLQLKRSHQVAWPALISLMQAARERGENPAAAAAALIDRLFSSRTIALGLDDLQPSARENQPSGMPPPMEERKKNAVIEIFNTLGKWERRKATSRCKLENALVYHGDTWGRALRFPRSLEGVGPGNLCKIIKNNTLSYGREVPLSTLPKIGETGEHKLTRWLHRRLLDWKKRENRPGRIERKKWNMNRLQREVIPILPQLTDGGRLHELVQRNGLLSARLDYSHREVFVYRDANGKCLLNPPRRRRTEGIAFSFKKAFRPDRKERAPAQEWHHLGLIDEKGVPTRRGRIFSFFNHGEGLAVAAALEDLSYDIGELVRDLANLRAGHRFSEFESAGRRLGYLCQATYGVTSYCGYLDKGKPLDYGEGAAEVLRELEANPKARDKFARQGMLAGDIERIELEWRSLLNQIAHAPDLPWRRWSDLKTAAHSLLGESKTSVLFHHFPPLPPAQQKRYEAGDRD